MFQVSVNESEWNLISEKHRKEYSNISIFVKQILNEMNGQDLSESLRPREDTR